MRTAMAPKRCSPSRRENTTANEVNSPAWSFTVPAVNDGPKRPLGHASPLGPESICSAEDSTTGGVPLHGVSEVSAA